MNARARFTPHGRPCRVSRLKSIYMIYLEGIGFRNPETEFEQIIWFLKQKAKTLSKAQKTAYFLSLKKTLTPTLVKCESFEILAYINTVVSSDQELQSKRRAARAKIVAELEMADLENRKRSFQAKQHFKELFKQFNTPN